MKINKATIIFPLLFLFTLISLGIILSVRVAQSREQEALVAWTETRQPLNYKNPSTESRTYPSDIIYLSTTQFEPLLLFMLGAGLLLIVTGIKMIHSRKLRLPLDPASPQATTSKQQLRVPLAKGKRRSSS